MSTAALIMMVLAWGYILFMVIYLFTKLLRKERQRKQEDLRNRNNETRPLA